MKEEEEEKKNKMKDTWFLKKLYKCLFAGMETNKVEKSLVIICWCSIFLFFFRFFFLLSSCISYAVCVRLMRENIKKKKKSKRIV